MSENMKVIAKIYNGYTSKFGIPRQSGLAPVLSKIVFEPEYRVKDAFRGIDGFSHLWLIWLFDKVIQKEWTPTVRPPKLGGNVRMGVFATRSPFRPNSMGLSSVKLVGVEFDEKLGPVLVVEGADLMDGTPILDVKPYLPYTDCHADATGGFALQDTVGQKVEIPDSLCRNLDERTLLEIRHILAQDPRPSYHDDKDRVYGFEYSGLEVKFTADGQRFTVVSIEKK